MMEMAKGRNNVQVRKATMMTLSSSASSPSNSSSTTNQMLEEDLSDLRRGPWTVEEDFKLINYIASHGEGRWNSLARCAGLKRTGKSCRLRWLNYLRPDVRRGNITLEEQLMILELHSRWGNRWSKIAQHLPGRTDNEIKNYWRTRVQKHAKQLKCDVNSKQFKDAMRYLWMPRLMERIQAAASSSTAPPTATLAAAPTSVPTCVANTNNDHHHLTNNNNDNMVNMGHVMGSSYYTPENSSTSDSFGTPISDLTTDYYNMPVNNPSPVDHYFSGGQVGYSDSIISPTGYFGHGLEFQSMDQNNNRPWSDGGDTTTSDSFWNADDIWFLHQNLNHNNM